MHSIICCGYLLLDAIIGSKADNVSFHAGGSSGNVSAVLASLGWRTAVAATLGNDKAGEYIRADLRSCGVSEDLLFTSESVQTPCVLQRNFLSNGALQTKFSRVCQQCGSMLPRVEADSLRQPLRAARILPPPGVFYVDFDSVETAEIARWFADQGTLVVFDGIRCNNPKTFTSLTATAHLVKYSDEWVPESEIRNRARLEIWTRGRSGVMWRRQGQDWHKQALAHPARNGDAVGSGDWLISGLLDTLARSSSGLLEGIHSDSLLVQALNQGQKLASANCGSLGARGAMYHELDASSPESTSQPENLETGKHFGIDVAIPRQVRENLRLVCPQCAAKSSAICPRESKEL